MEPKLILQLYIVEQEKHNVTYKNILLTQIWVGKCNEYFLKVKKSRCLLGYFYP